MQPHVKFGLGIAAFLLLAYLVMHYLTTLFLPFTIALLLAYLIEPMVNFFEQKVSFSRNLAVGTAILIVLFLLATALTLAFLKLYTEILNLSQVLPYYYNKFNKDIWDLINKLENFYLHLPSPVIELVQNNISRFYLALESILKTLLAPLAALPNLITILLISAVATYFISKDKKVIEKFAWSLLPNSWKEKTKRATNDVILSVIGFIKAQTILVSITTILTIVGLTIARIDYSVLIGIITGLFDFLPILGPSTIFLPWIFYNFLILENYGLGITLTIVYITLMTVRQIAEPKIVGEAIGLHPLASLMAMYVGFKLVGILGFIIGPLTLVTLKAVIRAGLIPKLPRE